MIPPSSEDAIKNKGIIEMHPTFVARSEGELSTIGEGDVILVQFNKGPGHGMQIDGHILKIYQKATIRGFIHDQTDGEAMAFQKVKLLKNDKDSTFVSGASTDLDGFYSIAGLQKGKYIIKLENQSDFYIKRFTSKKLEANKNSRFILIISSNKKLSLSKQKSNILKFTATIFAKEDPSIQIKKVLSFVYPGDNSFK